MPGPTLRLVCINDVYTLENLPRFRTLVERAAAVDPADVLLVTLAGDFLAPSMLASLDAGRGMVDCMNAIPITHVCFGNHEDDVPTAELWKRVHELRATWLSANVEGLPEPLPASQIITVGGKDQRTVRVGVLGVVMNDPAIYRRVPFGAKKVTDPGEALRTEAARLVREDRCDLVIPLTHQSIEDDRKLLTTIQDLPIPVVVGGHEHTPFIETVGRATIVKAGADAVLAIVIDLAWPEVAPTTGADLPRVTIREESVLAYPEDAAVRARVDGHMQKVKELSAATLKKLQPGEVLSSIGARAKPSTMGTFLASHLRDELGAEVAVLNGGGVRGSKEYTDRFTYGDLEAESPFDNEVVVVRIPGSVLVEAVASSRAHAPADSGGFLHGDDHTAVEGNVLTVLANAPVDPNRDYRVALVRDLLFGMDHIEPLVRFAAKYPERIPEAGIGRDIKHLLVSAFARALWKELGGREAVDANHDGVVTADEIAAAVRRVTSEPASPMTVDFVAHIADAPPSER